MSDVPQNPSSVGELSSPVVLFPAHDVSGFSCGEEELDRLLAQSALNRRKAMLSRTYVSLSGHEVAGYYTLAHVQLTASEMPSTMARGMPSSILARLAVDTRFQGRGLGESLFGEHFFVLWP